VNSSPLGRCPRTEGFDRDKKLQGFRVGKYSHEILLTDYAMATGMIVITGGKIREVKIRMDEKSIMKNDPDSYGECNVLLHFALFHSQ
jgi:hypothetical protein